VKPLSFSLPSSTDCHCLVWYIAADSHFSMIDYPHISSAMVHFDCFCDLVPCPLQIPQFTPEIADSGLDDDDATEKGEDQMISHFSALGSTDSPSTAVIPPSSGMAAGLDAGRAAELEAGLHLLYGALTAACAGPQSDLVSMTFERGDCPCVW
jgi:hypothetical protein